MSRSIGPWPPTPLDLVNVQTNAEALADIPRDLSAGNAAMFGHLVGGDLVGPDLTPNPAPIQPGQGLRGHDHSGGQSGRPFGRTIWTRTHDHDGDGGFTPNAQTAFKQVFATYRDGESNDYVFTTAAVRVPGCDPGPTGAYTLLAVAVRVRVTGPFQNIGAGEVSVRIRNRHPNAFATYDYVFFGDLAGVQNIQSDGATYPLIHVVPGVVNPIQYGFNVRHIPTTTVTKETGLEIEEIELGVFSVPV